MIDGTGSPQCRPAGPLAAVGILLADRSSCCVVIARSISRSTSRCCYQQAADRARDHRSVDAVRLVGHLYLPLHADRCAAVHATGPAVADAAAWAWLVVKLPCWHHRGLVFEPWIGAIAGSCSSPRGVSADRPRPRHRQCQHDHRPRAARRGALAGSRGGVVDRPADGAHAEAAPHSGARVPRVSATARLRRLGRVDRGGRRAHGVRSSGRSMAGVFDTLREPLERTFTANSGGQRCSDRSASSWA